MFVVYYCFQGLNIIFLSSVPFCIQPKKPVPQNVMLFFSKDGTHIHTPNHTPCNYQCKHTCTLHNACNKTPVLCGRICGVVKIYYLLLSVCLKFLSQARHVWKVDGLMSKSLCEDRNNWNSLCFFVFNLSLKGMCGSVLCEPECHWYWKQPVAEISNKSHLKCAWSNFFMGR